MEGGGLFSKILKGPQEQMLRDGEQPGGERGEEAGMSLTPETQAFTAPAGSHVTPTLSSSFHVCLVVSLCPGVTQFLRLQSVRTFQTAAAQETRQASQEGPQSNWGSLLAHFFTS